MATHAFKPCPSDDRVSGLPSWIVIAALLFGLDAGALATEPSVAAALTAQQIVDNNVAARGGLQAWHEIQTMVWVGRMQSAHAPMPSMPFVLEQKRPNKTRFELNAMSQKTLRVFDGEQGWKLRPGRDGSPDVEPYSPLELKFAQQAQGIDAPLVDAQSRASAVALEAIDEVEGRKAYRLLVHSASGERHHVWVDAQTFLDVKVDRMAYGADGVPRTVSVFYRDFRTVDGLQIPMSIETGVGSSMPPDKMTIERISLNLALDDRVFAKPGAQARRDPLATGTLPGPEVWRRPARSAPTTAVSADSNSASR